MNANAESIANQAYAAWELLEFREAAEQFLAAANAESQAAKQRSKWASPDSSFLYRIRAAFCLWQDGQFERAEPMLVEATAFDWKSAKLWSDRHSAERAFAYLLSPLAKNDKKVAFVELWAVATKRMAELDYPFPSTVPNQKLLLVACINLDYADGCRQIASNIDPGVLLKDHELQMLKSQSEKIAR